MRLHKSQDQGMISVILNDVGIWVQITLHAGSERGRIIFQKMLAKIC